MSRPVRDSDDIVTAFRDGQVTLRKNRREDGFTNALQEIGYQGIRKGDLVIHAMDGFAGAIGVSDSDGKSSPVYSACVPVRPDVDSKYFALFLRDLALRGFVTCLTRGIRERSTEFRYAEFKELVLPIPTAAEQGSIVHFLDLETAKIDTLIDQQEQLIKLLEEKRQAVISHAVTKGLNPGVRMKDSGVEWLGEVPEHWYVGRLKYLTTRVVDGTHFTPTYVEDGVPFLRVTDIHRGDINLADVKTIPIEEHRELVKRCRPQVGDILLSKNGTIGVPRLVDWDWEFSIFVSLCLIRFRHSIQPKFAEVFFLSSQLQDQIFGLTKQSTVTNLHLDKIVNFWFCVPPIEEQSEILKALDVKLKDIDGLIGNSWEALNLLRERRTTLISAAVTGKIDVREVA
jgi:type I restriction enzyme S subunit